MSKRYALFAVLFLLSCTRGEVVPSPPPTQTPTPPVTVPTTPTPRPGDVPEPMVRVGILVDTTAAVISASTPFTVASLDGTVLGQGDANEAWTFTAEGQLVRGASASGRSIGPAQAPLRVTPRDSGTITIAGKNYRGTALIRVARDGRVSAINVVEIEEYLAGVVSFEIGKLAPNLIEASKAQAIAARTYAIGNLNRWNQRGFDFLPTVLDQVYGGVTGEDTVTTRAVLETRGEIVTYEGKPIQAFYSSTCGGRTAAVEDVWPWRASQPYLRSVPDTIGGTERAYCETSSRFRWSVSWTREALRSVLAETLGARAKRRLPITRPDPADRMDIRRVENVALTGKTSGERAEFVRIRVDGQTHDIRGDSIRWILRPDPTRLLNSSFLLDVKADVSDGEVHRLEVNGGGWGHAIGMCQVGAINRAKAGQSYRQILLAYYSGTRIDRLY